MRGTPTKYYLLLASLLVSLCSTSSASSNMLTQQTAQQAYQNGQYELAIERWEDILPSLSGSAYIDLLIQIATTQLSLGQVNKSLENLLSAKSLAEQSPTYPHLALIYSQLSDAYLLARFESQAHNYAKLAVQTARTHPQKSILATALNHLGNVLMSRQQYGEALLLYVQASNITRTLNESALHISISLNMVHAMILSKSIDQKIIAIFNEVNQKLDKLPSTAKKAFSLLSLGYLAQEFSKYNTANPHDTSLISHHSYTKALSIGEQINNTRIRSYAVGHLGELYLAQNELPQAHRLMRQALFFAYEIDAPELAARWHWQLGRLQLALHHQDAAIDAYLASIDQLQRIQPALVYGQRGNPHSFLDKVGTVYREYADILLQKAQAIDHSGDKLALLRQARSTMESLKTVELRNYFRDSCVTERREQNHAMDLDNILPPGTATIYPIVLASRLELVVGFANGDIQQTTVAISSAELAETVSLFRKQLARSANPRRLRKHGQTLYDWLIQPIRDSLNKHAIDTLVIVPDDSLRTIPFSALFDGEAFLVEQFALVLSPGLTLTDANKKHSTNDRVLLNGLSKSVQEYAPLPHVLAELNKIASLYPHTKLVDTSYSSKNIEKQLLNNTYSSIVFATHGRFHSDPQQSYILTYDGKISLDELDRIIRINQFRDQALDLLVLSACETAEGDERAALGFAGVAVKAGAKSVLASLWKVNDASTAQLVPDFFKNIKDAKLSKAKALQQAQLSLIRDQAFASPYHWASFVLIGSWF